MVICQLEQAPFDRLCQTLLDHAWVQPLDPTFSVTLHLGSQEYILKLQPEEGNQVAILQALRVYREEDGPSFDLVLDSPTLSQLWDQFLAHPLSPCRLTKNSLEQSREFLYDQNTRRVSPPQRRNKVKCVFWRDMRVPENTSRPVSAPSGARSRPKIHFREPSKAGP